VKTKYRINDTKATPFGGIYVLNEFFHTIRFNSIFHSVFGKYRKVRQHLPVDNIKLIMASIISGGERLYDVQKFENDPVIPDLFGISSVPQDTSLRDDFEHIGDMDNQRRELLFKLHEEFFLKQKIRSVTIDIDGSALPVDGHQEAAEKGYCPTEPGSRCFQTLAAICDQTETAIAEQTSSGNTVWSADDSKVFCQSFLNRFSPQMDKITLRMDAGFYSDDLLKCLESYGNVTYLIGRPIPAWLQNKVTKIEYKQYYQSNRQYAWFCYNEGLDGKTRYYYVERTPKDPKIQTDLFECNEYTYRVIVSNEYRQPHVMFRVYNKRGRIEKHIEELKNQYALGKMISRNFTITKTLCWLSYLTFTLMGMLRKIAFKRDMVRYRLRRLRFLLFTNVATLPNHARTRILNISLHRITPWKFKFIMDRIWAY
jgi:hypothetical protein